jgi:hypothetical protein
MLCANDGDHLHRIQAKRLHVESQVELIDRIRDSGTVSLILIQLNGAQYKCPRYVLLCSRLSMKY